MAEKKQFVEPRLTKHEEPLNKVTLNFGSYGNGQCPGPRRRRRHRRKRWG